MREDRHPRIERIAIFYRPENKKAVFWAKKIGNFIKTARPSITISNEKPDALIALGGDGTILQAARHYQKQNPVILGLNLGNAGFLAAVRDSGQFLQKIREFLDGNYKISQRLTLVAEVWRNGKKIFRAPAINDVVVQNLLGVSALKVVVEKHPIQYIYGSGLLVATATGSTAYNLSAHGPIVVPHMRCLIISELLDHNIPTPSIILDGDEKITVQILKFRERGLLSLAQSGEPVDMILSTDGASIFALRPSDEIRIRKSARPVRFAVLEKNYFFKSLQEKFAFK